MFAIVMGVDSAECGLQANRVCLQKGYKQAVLEALPSLRNLDGDRNPRWEGYPSYWQAAEDANEVAENLQQHKPDFSFPIPLRWLAPDVFVVPPFATGPCSGMQLEKKLQAVDSRFQVSSDFQIGAWV
jgi:hypothetical protein